jgi:hypothetical protein
LSEEEITAIELVIDGSNRAVTQSVSRRETRSRGTGSHVDFTNSTKGLGEEPTNGSTEQHNGEKDAAQNKNDVERG